jgi:hypothetical protein
MTNMIKYLCLLTIFFSLSSGLYAEDVIERYIPATFCGEDTDESYCAQRIERACIQDLGNKVKRIDDQLVLRLQNGSTIIRKNSPKDIEGFWESKDKPNAQYRLYAYLLKAGFYVLLVEYWEDTGYQFISEKDGRSIGVYGPPRFSPDRSMFFVAESTPYWSSGETTELKICSLKSGTLSKIWSHTTENWPPVASFWISDNEIHLYERQQKGTRLTRGRKLGVVRFSNGRWTLQETQRQKGSEKR